MSTGSTESQLLQLEMRIGLAGLDQLSQISGRSRYHLVSTGCTIDVESRRMDLQALGMGVSTLVSSKGNLMDSVSLLAAFD